LDDTLVFFAIFVLLVVNSTSGGNVMTKSTTKLINQGENLARDLRREGRRVDAQTVDDLLQVIAAGGDEIESAPFLTTGEVAQRVGVSRQTVVNWVKRGILPGGRLGGRTLIAPAALRRFAKLEAILDELDAERPPATPDEAAKSVQQTRKRSHWPQQKQ
jgi:excisionase family DNA binding protein